ncbi:hypothetical protein [Streptomyces sp. NPDC008139]|uniref:hypothetical protein n=1 Tax=Streptomyces sp. NPDC008139 TaxID=3364814 RepID=UPI0036E4B594
MTAFEEALRGLRDHPAAAGSSAPPRHNVLVFYGLGGIGKSTLSRQLERRLREGELDGASADGPERRVTCRIDLEDSSLADLETAVIAVRGTLGEVMRSCPAFDLAFAVYWRRCHPGVPLEAAIARNSSLGRLGESLSLAEQLDGTLDALLGPIPLAGVARRAAGILVGRIREHLRKDRLLAECPGFAELLDVESPADMLPFLPALLSWDLAEYRRRKSLDVVIFFDTFERVDGRRREAGGLEDRLARLVYLMPNVLFLITGRNRLTWGDGHHPAIHYSGPNYWPSLVTDPGTLPAMQHRLSGLEEDYADTYLRLRLTRDGEPAIPAPLRRRIIDAAGGVPLYLELSAEYFDQLSAEGRVPAVEQFGGTFAEMVIRVMRDLSAEERALLRAASLAERFDADLLRAAVPSVADAVVRRFLERPLVQSDSSRWLTHTVDEYVRNAVRLHDGNTDDAWSEEEWRSAAERVLEHLRDRLRGGVRNPTSTDRSELGEGFTTAGLLTLNTSRVPDWLYDLAYGVDLCGLGAVLTGTRNWPVQSGSHPAGALALTCQGMAARSAGDRTAALSLTEAALAHPGIGPYQRLFISHRLAKTLEEFGRYAEAERLTAEVAAEPGPLRENAEKDLAWIQWLRGDGRRLQTWALPHCDSPLGFRRAQSQDLLGQFSFLQGDFAAAERYLRKVADDAELAAAGMSRDTSYRHLGMVLSLARPLDAETVLEHAHEINQDVGTPVGVAQTLIWRAAARTGREPAAEVLTLLTNGEEMLARSGGGADRWMVLTVKLFLAAVESTDAEVLAAGRELISHVEEQDCHPGLGEIAQRWLEVRGLDVAVPRREFWTDRDRSLAAWEKVLTDRRGLRAATSDG